MTDLTPSVSNILAVYDTATKAQITDGLLWYHRAQNIAVQLATEFDVPTVCACGVLAALSPRNKWERNVVDARTVLSGVAFDTAKVCTFNPNKVKAYAILEAQTVGDVEKILSGQKLLNFFRNILNPEGEAVTIDFHAYSIAVAHRFTSDKAPAMSSKVYKNLQELYREAAKIVGISPSQLQAVTWVAWREAV